MFSLIHKTMRIVVVMPMKMMKMMMIMTVMWGQQYLRR